MAMGDETERDETATGRKVELMGQSQRGDAAAYAELKAMGGAGIVREWSETILLMRLQDRAGGKNLLAREAVACDLASVEAGLADRRDGPIERMIVKRAALCAIDANLADREHVNAIVGERPRAAVEAMDRRRDRAHRRLLSTLKALAEVRRMNRPVVQVNVGGGNVNVFKA